MKIVIVGAGACGLGAARHSAELIRDIPDSEIIILEKSATLGGFWCWDEESHGSLYNDVHINTPKELMAFQDFPFPESEESFVHQSVVRKYLDSYAEHFDLKKYVSLNTEVTDVCPLLPEERDSGWRVRVKDLLTCEERIITADLIFITGIHGNNGAADPDLIKNFSGNGNQCSGDGLAFAPEDWTREKVVLVVGKGLLKDDDIIVIAKQSANVLITSDIVDVSSRNLPSNVIKVGEIKSIEGKMVEFKCGKVTQVDTIVWNKGLNLSIPYLHEDCGVTIIHDGQVLDPFYLHLININHPTMAIFISSSGAFPFLQIDQEVKCFLNLHKNKNMPTKEKMLEWLKKDTEWRTSQGLKPEQRHKMLMMSFHWGRHMDSLAKLGNIPPLDSVYKKMFIYTLALKNVKGLYFTRSVRFILDKERNTFKVAPSLWKVNTLYYLELSSSNLSTFVYNNEMNNE